MSSALSALQPQQGMPAPSTTAKPTATPHVATPPGFEETTSALPLERHPPSTAPAFVSSLRRSLEDNSEDENEVPLSTATGSVQRSAKPKKGHRGRSASAIARRNAISMSRLVAKHMAEHVLE
ncbi:hypothetical protein SPRG_18950 [Saprolegnia parasitica CBS 223.65]|uniref:Uncharacterized protein n=1 Tax=Saprolegnia parasitica (strain CBS 223.65) TaxID=695850 RepID=A0A067D883_SAPPC|nr:hypothetical protein SPRG_18950 [Saprolegnia parasitica CBS 223.65]KDO34881.1 hypothetical protein SPRG_18950 [Saprolegnia parasitica CBS 223.65]|eukprot:XP_012194817.1 hypothetical protein SPRG_18950 [Saprolegnia parasitica CBS 223.65]